MTKQATVELLQKQLPGFYSVEQVIDLINKIEEPATEGTGTLSEDQLEAIIDQISSKMISKISREYGTDYVDVDSAEFSLSGNQIELDSIDLDYSCITEVATDIVRDVLVDAFPAPAEAEEETEEVEA